jgi:hypothetical protein
MGMDIESVSGHPAVFYTLLAVAIFGILFGALSRGTTGFGEWVKALRRIGSDFKAADIASRDTQIANLILDLDSEREARRKDRERFEQELLARDFAQDQRDDLIRDHLIWDWKVYNVLVLAGLLDKDSKPPPLH